ncbi:MAG: bifunctional alpha/beta hydrolase/OsmC family protein [Flavobacteriaceae bacterium]
MNLTKVSFTNKEGQKLNGRLELPVDQHPHNMVLFAHCFTCTKNLSAVKNISKGLTSSGFGVLRFDFTGLGESEGDFADTNFSGNVEDLIAAADFLKKDYQAPSLLIGHSLGGAAVIYAAARLHTVKAVATVGAPADPSHVKHLLKSSIEEIRSNGKAVVNISGRDFTVKEQFLNDLEKNSLSDTLENLNKSILIMHSPQDNIVGIKNAEKLYHNARHPKSFISLDGADHLLSNKVDSLYVGKTIASWAERYLVVPDPSELRTRHQVVASLDTDDGFTTQIKVGKHNLVADEPEGFGGNDFGPSPYEFVSAGLSACTVMTLQMYARRKNWDLQNVKVHTSYGKVHAEDCAECESDTAKIDTFERQIALSGSLEPRQKERLLEIADKCPVHRTLEAHSHIKTELIE